MAVGLFSQITSERTRGEGFNFVWQANYDLVAFIETWWDCPHNWSAAMDGYKLFRRGRQGSRGCGVTLLEIAKSLSTVCQHPWSTGDGPEDWRLADATPIYKKGCREDLRNCRPISLTWFQERLWSRLSRGRSHSMCRATGESGCATMASWKANPARPTWSPMMAWPTWWMRKRLWAVYLDFSSAFDRQCLQQYSHRKASCGLVRYVLS